MAVEGTSLVTTTGVTASASLLVPTISWALAGFPHDHIPESTPLLIATVLVVGFHAASKIAIAWWNKRNQPAPEAPKTGVTT